jgi:hypothetical protein
MATKGTNGTNGTDGTDVGATLANKEIAFKTNAGAVDGIPIGTAGQFLKVNSGATGYEYGAVSSDFVRIANLNLTSGTKATFDNIFSNSDGYQNYKCIIHKWKPSANKWLKFRWRASSADLSNNYKWRSDGFRRKGDNGFDHAVYGANGSDFIPVTYWSTRSDGHTHADIDLGNPSVLTNGHLINTRTVVYESDNGIMANYSVGCRESSNYYEGFSLEVNDGSTAVTNFDVSVYGIK